jgi:hypothetical protein
VASIAEEAYPATVQLLCEAVETIEMLRLLVGIKDETMLEGMDPEGRA